MKLTARLALSQLKVNRRRTTWTLVGIILATAIITGVYSLGFGSGLEFLDRFVGDAPFRHIYNGIITGIAGLLSIIILSISIIVISNAFRVSASERSAQFGILKSVGGTRRQITETVVYEAIFLTAIGIPTGIFVGLMVQLASVSLINHFIGISAQNDRFFNDVLYNGQIVRFIVSGFALAISFVVSFTTVMISAFLPANKAARVSAIDAIRGTGEVDIRNKKVWGSGLIKKLFKTEGLLAATFLKRSKRNFRATVIALSFSVILFIVAGAFFTQMARVSGVFWGGPDATALIRISPYVIWEEVGRGQFSGVQADTRDITIQEINEITVRLQSFLDDEDVIFGVAQQWMSSYLPEEMVTGQRQEVREYQWNQQGWRLSAEERNFHTLSLVMVHESLYAELVQRAGVPIGSNILVNQAEFQFGDGRRMVYVPFHFDDTITLEYHEWDDHLQQAVVTEIEIHGQLSGNDVPAELFKIWNGFDQPLMVITPEIDVRDYEWFITTERPGAVLAYAAEMLEPLIEEQIIDAYYRDMHADIAAQENSLRLSMILTYGFVGFLTAIGLTNVISTISENVRTRAKEFAVLQSVGMTIEGIKRMLSLESVLSSLKALMFGVPGGILFSKWIHRIMGWSVTFDYQLPWLPIGISIVVVFFVTWATMRYAAGRLKNQNIIETIRSGSGM